MPTPTHLPIVSQSLGSVSGGAPRITSLLVKPASAVCNLDCKYCFYLDREADPYKSMPARRMTDETLERLVDTYLFYSFPEVAFAFQGGEPTLAGLPFFEKLVRLEREYARPGHRISNSIQTNGVLIDRNWCDLLQNNWLVGISLDGPEDVHDRYRLNRGGQGTWRQVVNAVELLQRNSVEFNILCVLSQANVDRPADLYRFYRKLGVDNVQFIPLSEFAPDGTPLPFTITPEQYGHFMCEIFDPWWPERRKVRVRFFDNLAEAMAGLRPATCTMHESCDSYVVVEYNGDVYPCDFFVESRWRLGNIELDSWSEIARRQRRYEFAANKAIPHEECQRCEWQSICHQGCPKHRHDRHGRFEDLDYFCQAYKMIFAKAAAPLQADVQKLYGRKPSD